MCRGALAARKEEVFTLQPGLIQPRFEGCSGLSCDFKLHRAMSFLLHYDGTLRHMDSVRDISNSQLGQVACS